MRQIPILSGMPWSRNLQLVFASAVILITEPLGTVFAEQMRINDRLFWSFYTSSQASCHNISKFI
jgi:hypothetical protein